MLLWINLQANKNAAEQSKTCLHVPSCYCYLAPNL